MWRHAHLHPLAAPWLPASAWQLPETRSAPHAFLHLLRFLTPPLGRSFLLAGTDEYSLVDALREKRITKPVVAWVRCVSRGV